jgi:hypothetical protein
MAVADIFGMFRCAYLSICSQRSGDVQLTRTAGLYDLVHGYPGTPRC